MKIFFILLPGSMGSIMLWFLVLKLFLYHLLLWDLVVPLKRSLYVAILASAFFVCFGCIVSPFELGIFIRGTVNLIKSLRLKVSAASDFAKTLSKHYKQGGGDIETSTNAPVPVLLPTCLRVYITTRHCGRVRAKNLSPHTLRFGSFVPYL